MKPPLASLRDRPLGVHVLALYYKRVLDRQADRQPVKPPAPIQLRLPIGPKP